jgi:cell division septation protein DedD
MHRSDDGTTTLLTPAYDGLDDDTGNDIFTAVSPTGLSTFVLTAVAPIVTTSTTNSDSGSSWSSASADAAARENAAYSATAAITATPTGTPTPTATPVPAETTKLKVRITPWPTTQVAADPGQVAAEPVADIASAKISASGVLKNPYLFTAEAIAAVAIFSIGIAGYIKRRKRNRDPLRWEDRK